MLHGEEVKRSGRSDLQIGYLEISTQIPLTSAQERALLLAILNRLGLLRAQTQIWTRRGGRVGVGVEEYEEEEERSKKMASGV